MSRKKIIIILLSVGFLFSLLVYLIQNANGSKNIVFYYSQTCPYCKQVEKYISEKSLESKVTIERRLVFNTSDKSLDKQEMGTLCGVSMDSVGVPLIYFKRKCYMGTPDIVELLSQFTNNK